MTLEYYGFHLATHSCDNRADCEDLKKAKAFAFETCYKAMHRKGYDAQVVRSTDFKLERG